MADWFPCNISSKYEWISMKLHQWLHSRNPKVKFSHGRNLRVLISSVASDWLIGFRAISQVNMNRFQQKLHQWLHSRNPKVQFGHGRNLRILISSVASDWLIGFRAISQVNMNGFQRNFISGFIAGIRRSSSVMGKIRAY